MKHLFLLIHYSDHPRPSQVTVYKNQNSKSQKPKTKMLIKPTHQQKP